LLSSQQIDGSRGEGMVTDYSNRGFVLETCCDPDNDGYGGTDDLSNTCLIDNCPDMYNPDMVLVK